LSTKDKRLQQRQPRTEECLLHHVNFVSKSENASFEGKQPDLPKTAPESPTEMSRLTAGYRLCARSEGKSRNTVDIVVSSVACFAGFLRSEGLPTDVTQIGRQEMRGFILHPQ
jgi:hypothetical protein